MLFIPLAIFSALYLGAFLLSLSVLKRTRDGRLYPHVWAIVLSTALLWLSIVLVMHGRGIAQLLADSIAHPYEDAWALRSIGLFFAFIWAAPTPIALAAIFARPIGTWWRISVVRMVFGTGVVISAALVLLFRGVCLVVIRDQLGNPVPDATITYYLDGRATGTSDEEGHVRIPFYRKLHRLDIVAAKADGYDIDYRMSSHRPYNPIPSEVKLPAWKIMRAPQLLLARPDIEIKTDERPYYINLVRQQASVEPLRVTDLEIKVKGPDEPPSAKSWELHTKRYPWSVEIRCRRGGLQLAPEGYRYLAPPDKYQDSYCQTFLPEDKGWNSSFQKTFYLQLRDGKVFAVAEITITTLDDKKRIIFIDAKINPAADRNLYWGCGGLLDPNSAGTTSWLTRLLGNEY